MPGGVAWIALAGFGGWVFGKRGDERWRRTVLSSPPVPPVPSPVSPVPSPGLPGPLPGLPGPPRPRLSLQRGDARGQEAFTKAASLHLSISPSLLPSIPPAGVSGSHNSKSRISYYKKKKKIRKKMKNLQSGVHFQSPQPYLRVHLLGTATHCLAHSTTRRK